MEALRKLHNDDLGKLLLRLVVGGLMLFHGIGKVRGGIDGIAAGLPEDIRFVAYGVYLGEVVGPALVLIGFLTRPGALLIAINMIVAVSMVHSHQVLSINERGIYELELQAFYLFGALAIFFLGAGRYSVSRGMSVWD